MWRVKVMATWNRIEGISEIDGKRPRWRIFLLEIFYQTIHILGYDS